MDSKSNDLEGYHPFVDEDGGEYGSFEVFWHDTDLTSESTASHGPGAQTVEEGWYWWACHPGCLPDGDESGPFATSKEAYDDARAA